MNINNLKDRQKQIVASMEELIADWSDDKQASFDSLQSEFDKNSASIDTFEKLEKIKQDNERAANAKSPHRKRIVGPINDDYDFTPVSDSQWCDSNGNAVKVYGKSEKMSNSSLSVGRYVKGLLTGNWAGSEEERGLFASTTTNLAGGGYAIPSVLMSNIIDLARAKMVLSDAGCQTVNLQDGWNKILRLTADPTAEIKAEGEGLTGSSPSFDLVEFKPVTIGAMVTLSNELAQDAANLAAVLESSMAAAVAQKLDYLGLYGAGGTEPTGIKNTVGINTVDVTSWDYDTIIDGVTECQENNIEPKSFIMSPLTNSTLSKLKDDYGRYLSAPDDVVKLNKLTTKSMSNDDLILGDFSNIILGIRQNAFIETSAVNGDNFKTYSVSFRIIMRADWAVVRPSAFTLCSKNIS